MFIFSLGICLGGDIIYMYSASSQDYKFHDTRALSINIMHIVCIQIEWERDVIF